MAAGFPDVFEEHGSAVEVKKDRNEKGKRPRSAQRCRTCRAAVREEPNAARSPVAMGVVVATSVYCGVKAGIQGYQHLRRRNLRHLVKQVAPVLDDLGVQYFADFGTLLGMYREKDIILYDNDADFVVLNPDWDTLLETLRDRLKPKGFRVFYVVPSEDRSIKWIRVVSGVGIMDLYGGFTDLTPNSSSNASTPAAAADHPTEQQKALAAAAAASVPMVSIPQGHGDLCDVPASYIFPLGVMKFRGVPVSVPGDVCGVLRYRYGDTFLIPRYMDKGRDCVEQGKLYARLLGALGKAGLRV
eukprot:GHUV01002764.1.p1 GENE.GHUV01002764.1~~GHUV01002764.1.p1  ORF type:complete len:300 (+),score=73.73 GHUV01002764.1:902-1801(+)